MTPSFRDVVLRRGTTHPNVAVDVRFSKDTGQNTAFFVAVLNVAVTD